MAEPLLIPADAAQRLLAAANGDAALLYLYLFENRPLSGAQTALRILCLCKAKLLSHGYPSADRGS